MNRGIESLSNKGIEFIGNSLSLEEKYKTIIVIGVARGGTSLIAGTLQHLGVFTGKKSAKPVFEDVLLASAFENNDLEKAKEIINNYNELYDIWAFKRPKSIDYIKNLDTLCRNPIYIFIFKDIFSISNRNNISMKQDIITGLKNAQNEYSKVLNFLSKKNDINAFLISYEKLLTNQEVYINTLLKIINQDISKEKIALAYDFIEPNPKDYINASRITRSTGKIGAIKNNNVIGWAKYTYSNKIAKVELYINDKKVEDKEAKDFRPNILEEKKHPTGYCGFIFNLDKYKLKEGDIIKAKVSEDVLFLNSVKYKKENK